jgi:hypothetical protein
MGLAGEMVGLLGAEFTVTFVPELLLQVPLLTVYVIIALPAPTPVTTPELSTVATKVLLLLQLPPGVVGVSVTLPPWQNVVEPDGVTAGDGAAVGVMFPVVAGALVPHAFVAVTDTLPTPEPMVMVADVVFAPAVTAHPVPVTDQVYEAAPVTAAILNVLPVEPTHLLAGCVIVPGVVGAPVVA